MEIASGIYGVDFDRRVWAYLVEGDGLTLIDAGIAGRMGALTDALAGIGAAPGDIRRVVLTHFHRDHVGTVAELRELTDAEVIAHEADAAAIEGRQSGPEPTLTAQEEVIFDQVTGGIDEAPPAKVDREVADGESIDFGAGVRATVIHVPGHTAGSIALYLPESAVLFTGDAAASMNGQPIAGVFNVDGDEARRSFIRLAELEAETACFGHGPPIFEAASASLSRSARSTRNS